LLVQDSVQECVSLIQEANSIAALTGAGISTSAGIPDFRGPQGLYVTRQYDPDKVFDINYFYQDPAPFYAFARDFISLENKIQPTKAHRFLGELEKNHKIKGIITQNIDSLHQMAGSSQVYEMHGSFWLSHCLDCGKEFSFDEMKTKLKEMDIPQCSCQGLIKPDVVFFGENVKFLNESADLARDVDLFFVIGTSCVVYPAAMLPSYVTGKIIVINQDEVALSSNHIALTVKEDIDRFFQKVSDVLFS